MKKILFVTSQLLIGGTETALYETVKLLNSPSVEITVAVVKPGGDLYADFEKICTVKDMSEQYSRALITRELLKDNIKKFKIISFIKNFSLKILEKYVYSHFKFKDNISKRMPRIDEEYDVAVAYSAPYTSIESFVINNVNAKKKFAWIHFDVANYIKDINVSHFSSCYEKFDKIICVSKASESTFLQRHPSLYGKTAVIYNPIDSSKIMRYSSEESACDFSKRQTTLCSVGRISKDKGFDLAVRAHALLRKKGHKLKWLICGDGDYKSSIKSLTEENDLNNDFILLGNQKNPYKYIRSSDIYVQPSRTESYCITLAEARALKKPIVTTNFPCASEHIIHEHNGFICEMTPESIADAIEKLILSPELREKFSNNTTPVDSDHTKLKQLFE